LEIYRATEAVGAAAGFKGADHPVITAGFIVNSGAPEVDGGAAQAVVGLGPYRVLADAHCIVNRHAAAITTVTSIPIRAAGSRAQASLGRESTALSLPKDIEGVALRTVVGIVNAHYYCAAPARVAYQLLGAAAIDTLESKIHRIGRHRRRAFEAAKLRGLAEQIAEGRTVTADFHLGRSVDDDFDSASAFGTAATGKICSSFHGLGMGRPGQKS